MTGGVGTGQQLPGTADPVRKAKVFGTFGLAIFTFSFLANVNTTPQLATFGLGSIVLMAAAIMFFLGPTAMASAEMGSTWPRTGGIYVWTRMAFGEPAGFAIIWLEWANFVVAWPGIIGTIILQTSFTFDPALGDNKLFIMAVVISITWLAAGFALRGINAAKGFAFYSVIAGTVIPAVVLVGFAIWYIAAGNPMAMEVSAGALVPDVSANIAFISGALLMFSGIEVSAIHAGDVENPSVAIPRSNKIAVGMAFLFFAPLTLAIAAVIPADQIDIVTGLVQSGQVIFDKLGTGWMTPIFTLLLVTGLIAALVQIISGPSRGLLVAGRQGGNLPPWLQKENGNKMAVSIILAQAVISSVLAIGYSVLGSVQNAWFMFALIQTNMTLVMYLIMFASVIKLRFSKRDVVRPYSIPGKWVGLWAVTGVGMLVCVSGVLISLIPTDEAAGMPAWLYIAILIVGTVAFVCMPFIFWIFRKPSWKTSDALDRGVDDDATGVPAQTAAAGSG